MGDFYMMPKEALYDGRLSLLAFKVLAVLCDMANPEGECWPSQTYLADKLGRSRQVINPAIKELEKAKYILTTETSSVNNYKIIALLGVKYTLQGCQENLTGVSSIPDRGVKYTLHSYKDNKTQRIKPKEQEKKKPTKKSLSKSYPMFDGWEPDDWDSCLAVGYKLGLTPLEIDQEYGKMHDYFLEKPNDCRPGWDRTFKKWLDNSVNNFTRKKQS